MVGVLGNVETLKLLNVGAAEVVVVIPGAVVVGVVVVVFAGAVIAGLLVVEVSVELKLD
jgi:hypothetical protein